LHPFLQTYKTLLRQTNAVCLVAGKEYFWSVGLNLLIGFTSFMIWTYALRWFPQISQTVSLIISAKICVISGNVFLGLRKFSYDFKIKTINFSNMDQPDSLNLVAEFHRTFKHPILPHPAIPDETRCQLRIALIAEELKELEVAVLQKDMVEIADALCDLQYVLSGAILEFGLGKKFKSLFEEVQRSNMSKACSSEEEARQTVAHYLEKDGTQCYYKPIDGKWLVYRTSDNKTIKSVKYSPANLNKVLYG